MKRSGLAWKVMIARGDIFNEAPYVYLAFVQQRIASYCRNEGIPFLVATGILESMKYFPKPTRAEIGDVWNALREGPESIVLSAETSNSRYPIEAVKTLSSIIDSYES